MQGGPDQTIIYPYNADNHLELSGALSDDKLHRRGKLSSKAL